MPVAAVLLLWGASSPDVHFGYDGAAEVYVLDGNRPEEWPSELVAGPLDPADGAVTIVECKLRANPQIRREVVGQVLAYAGGLWQMSYEAAWGDVPQDVTFSVAAAAQHAGVVAGVETG